MDKPATIDDKFIYLSNEYPDPDLPPTYLWVGKADSQLFNKTNVSLDESSRQLRTFMREGLTEQELETNQPSGAFDPKVSEDNQDNSWRQFSSDIDPDFGSPEDSSTNDISMSGPGSATTDDDSQVVQVSRTRNRAARLNRCQGRGGPGKKRGLRKPLEPSIEFKALYSQAMTAYLELDLTKAESLILQAIQINPERFEAHSLVSALYRARQDDSKALAALFNGAHTKPRDIHIWLFLAESFAARVGNNEVAIYCCSRAISVDKNCAEARLERAALYRASGQISRAVVDCEHLLAQAPNDTYILSKVAGIYADLNEVDLALSHFDRCFRYYRAKESHNVTSITWSDVNIYIELWGHRHEWQKGIFQLKSLARWLLGRGNECFWDSFSRDDREWDREDEPRRVQAKEFISGKHEVSAYGIGLPIELRTKLGLYRLEMESSNFEEAISHFRWLDPEDCQSSAELLVYQGLFREVADALRGRGLFEEALKFYEPMQHHPKNQDSSYFTSMAVCYEASGLYTDAAESYQTALVHNSANTHAQIQLAVLCQELGIPNLAHVESNDEIPARISARQRSKKSNKMRSSSELSEALTMQQPPLTMIAPPTTFRKPKRVSIVREIREQAEERDCYALFDRMETLAERARGGDPDSRAEWMSAAKQLIDIFQSERAFFPNEKYMRFYGYSKEARRKSLNAKYEISTRENLAATGQHISRSDNESIPNEFRAIKFQSWLDIFLEYALTLAKCDNVQAAYKVTLSASNANIFYHSSQCMFIIHVCWFTCALLSNDEETLYNIARWFTKEYQFISDGYRLYAGLNCLVDKESAWYNSSPSQKYVLRQLKAMDFSLEGDTPYKTLFIEKAAFFTKDKRGNHIRAAHLDIALLMLYGHILYCGRSYAYSISLELPINYFLRAYALDSQNPMINLSLALGYIHHAIKRQAENRHHLIMQGFAFLFAYYDIRSASESAPERQEASFNIARVYHMLGLTHLGVQYYLECLEIGRHVGHIDADHAIENFSREAAYALQGIWAASGNDDKARDITEEWLVL